MATLGPTPAPPADFNINLDLIQAGNTWTLSITIFDGRGIQINLNLHTSAAEQFAKAILVATEQAKTKLLLPV
jgi:hypothetical protein